MILCDPTLSAPRFAPALGWDGFGIAEDVLLGPESHQMIRAWCKGSPSVGRAPLPVLLWVLQPHPLHRILGFNFRDKVACVKISAPSTLGSKYFMMACWDVDGCSLTNWKSVIQSCKVRFSRAFFFFFLETSCRWLQIILFGLVLTYYTWFIRCHCRLLVGFACERVRQLPIRISEMTCGRFRKENPPQDILHDNVYYPKRVYIIHYTEVPAAQHGSHPNPMHYKNYTLWRYTLWKSVL